MAISKSRRGSCFSSRNTNRLLVPSPLDLHLGSLLFLALLASCSALTIETTEVPEVNEVTTIIPAQIEESLPTQTSTNQNDTTISGYPVENPQADTTNPVFFVQSSEAEVQDSFVSVYGGNLEQDIKNDVNSEVEEAPFPEESLKETVPKVTEISALETENRETEAAVQNAREPKTLESPETEGNLAPEAQAEPEAVTDNIAMASEQDDPDSLSLNEERAITEQPITKTNLLALEQEHKAVEGENTGTPIPTYEETKHQVTKKQGVEDLLPIEEAPEVVEQLESAQEERQSEEPNPNINEIDGNTSEDVKAIPNTFFKSASELQEQIEKKSEEEAKAEIEKEVEGTAQPQETVVEAAEAEDSQPDEEEVVLETTQMSTFEETKPIEEDLKKDEHNGEQTKDKEEEPKEEEPKEEKSKEEETTDEEPTEEKPKEGEPIEEEPKEEKPKEQEVKVEEVEHKEEELKKEEPQEEVHHIDAEEPIIPASPSSTQNPVEQEVTPKTDAESVENKEEEPESVEDKEKDQEASEHKEDQNDSNSDSSSEEETHEPAADEAKPSSTDDSTATPLVSYPPHDAGQTFDSNSADEHSAQLSGPSNYRSTLIIALCSGTAVIFIVASLVIFVVSFQRQHGTLDIEMQEQRLGKDDRDEEDAQVKLLEVDLSTPVIVSLGNEETDECL
ncbi:probable serine/threonine-protein kinase kinX [Drosophila serrata]|uniref:probable serine/threonine-protein kinase kinX n=1 Tax=Drosophila serrata TaxID=7274 RepID=UPI000A1D0222|nr:probable serine/threonine-protein kinase kinX [Drosophila serrata]